MRAFALAATFALAVAPLAACSEDDKCGGHSHDPVCLVCQGDEDPLTPGESLAASNGFTLELVSAVPTPFNDELNELTVRLRKDGNLVDGADFTGTKTWYPPGGHGSPLLPMIAPAGATGEYHLTGINFVHAGRWELRFNLTSAGTTSEYFMPLCIEEAPGA
jgi:hypothetical protein